MTTTTTTNTKTTFTVTTSLTTRTTTASTTSQTVTTTNTPVDCVLADWSDWGKCDRPCNGGNRTRERQVLQMEVCNTSPCSDCLAGFYLVFVSDTATNCRYNPDPGATGPEACAPCLMGERSEEGASFCEPCAEGSAAAPILSRSVASSLGHFSGSFVSGPVGEAELSCGPGTCSGILSFKAACATQRLVQFSAETRSSMGQTALLELTVSGGAPVGWSTAGTTTWQETGLSASVLLPSEEQTTIRLWASQEAWPAEGCGNPSHSLAEC
ncbi:SSPO [Symbiodinium sp. CCMP2592]|nr:SSPO [Symbiodinium sp. CCMP2592]